MVSGKARHLLGSLRENNSLLDILTCAKEKLSNSRGIIPNSKVSLTHSKVDFFNSHYF